MPKIYGTSTSSTSVGGGLSAAYTFSNTTTEADPGNGKIRLNNASPAGVTAIYISKIDKDGFSREVLELMRFGDAILLNASKHSASQTYQLTAAPIDNTTWIKLLVTNELTDGSFLDNSHLEVTAIFSGASAYTELSDTPHSFTGDAGKLLAVNSGASAVEHRVLTGTDIPTTLPTDLNINGLTVGRGGGGLDSNVALGRSSGGSNTTGRNWTAVGHTAGGRNTTGDGWTAVGYSAGAYNTTGSFWTAVGSMAGFYNTTGRGWTAVGHAAGAYNTTGSFWTAVGYGAGQSNTTGSGNIFIGGLTNTGLVSPVFTVTTENNRIVMGSTAVTNAYIQVAWTVVSDARDKTNFGVVPHGLDFVNALNPISYQYRLDRDSDEPNGSVRYGFKAQEVLALEGDNPVIVDADDPDKLRFNSDSLIAVLVNSVKELTAMVKDLQAEVNELKGIA
jgi:hypothetical protein